MKKPLLTAKEFELLNEFSNDPTGQLSLIPKLINFDNVVIEKGEGGETESKFDGLSAQLVERKVLNKDTRKPIYYYDFAVTGHDAAGFNYRPGESFGFYPELPEEEVDWLAGRLQLDPKEVVSLPAETFSSFFPVRRGNKNAVRIGDILKRLDVRSVPKKAVLRTLSEYCQAEKDCQILLFLSSRNGSEAYNRLRNEEMFSIRLLLAALDSFKPSLAALVALAGPLQPRYYSCCRAQCNDNQNNFQIVFNVSGVCSTWLESLKLNLPVPIQKRSINHFKLPDEITDRPIIMIAAGTGVAPFIGFLEILASSAENSNFNWLIFGFRNRSDDFIFEDELTGHLNSGVLSKLSLAISRDLIEPKTYVQDVILHKERILFSQMIHEKEAIIYICGDELTMIKGVNDAILQIIMEGNPEISQKEAETILMNWTKEKRIIRDIWV